MIENGSAVHDVQEIASGFVVRAKPGQEAGFALLAGHILRNADTFTAFGEPSGCGGYLSIHVAPHE